jgi:hypothetical protein
MALANSSVKKYKGKGKEINESRIISSSGIAIKGTVCSKESLLLYVCNMVQELAAERFLTSITHKQLNQPYFKRTKAACYGQMKMT